MPDPRVIALAGPTASGKSAAALAIAREHGAEIISVDSALVYRGMDIGTAKPTAAELAAVPHHLIDIRDPLQAYSAAEFAADAARLVGEINARGKPALLVGGTMLYFKALFDGIDDMPPADAQVRAGLDAQAARDGQASLHAELSRVDPPTAARLAPGDTQRVQRALEVYRLSGRPLSSFHTRGEATGTSPFRETPLVSLEPRDRAWLHERIAQRFDLMLAAGFIDEVKRLRARGDLTPDLPSMRCVGYRQAWDMLDGVHAPGTLRDRGIAATRQLAKRQLTWLRGMPRRHVIACDAPDAAAQLLQAAREML
ncbi:tRNA (adenosine(37)-N6)-dimethylallyltransferase MiaA [Caenimonas aquaedulcis]|uniref:tRNA dimethylallyltransferase n=1 Tax=Caenimonas aquaedulcis TaxID=2793270 RepID=A0A931H362_9BURK|nr:tRNA (adenosine(37)-N6)-dimethylallyltransferase MiaA [Caenimonas aquaedulcis]MBG9387689.1 tRNA (adenosine(37)-N6)-dimethylallyltransferase MiaA [Caenimonas aquaedulcis]